MRSFEPSVRLFKSQMEKQHSVCLIIPTTDQCAAGKVGRRGVRQKFNPQHVRLRKPFISHLHLLVDLPLHGVRRFPAAFIFRWSPLLHLWHSPGSVRIRSGPPLAGGFSQWSGREGELSLPLTAPVIPRLCVPHLEPHTIGVH